MFNTEVFGKQLRPFTIGQHINKINSRFRWQICGMSVKTIPSNCAHRTSWTMFENDKCALLCSVAEGFCIFQRSDFCNFHLMCKRKQTFERKSVN